MASSNPQVKTLKGLIWLYLVLLLTEGALRKWVLKGGMADYAIIIRDPVVIAIYLLAMSTGRFVVNGIVAANFLLAAASFCAGIFVKDFNLMVALIGLRCYFLHLPLIFVMQKTLEKEDLWNMAKFLLWFSIPETALLVKQLNSPQDAWVNLGLGGMYTQGFSGALDKFRPSGTFSFTTGVASFYPLVLAALLGLLLSRRKIPIYLSIGAAACVVMGVYTSVSRTNAVTCAWVLAVASVAVLMLPNSPKRLVQLLIFGALGAMAASYLPHFDDGMEAFAARWKDATGTNLEGFQTNIVDRFFQGISFPPGLLYDTPLVGYGVGGGTQMAQKFLTNQHGFSMGEAEWPRLILEMGPVLGLAFIGLRLVLCVQMLRISIRSLQRQNIWPLLFAVQSIFLLVNSNWGQPNILGFAMFDTGLAFACTCLDVEKKTASTKRGQKHRAHGRKWQLPEPQPAVPVGAPSPTP